MGFAPKRVAAIAWLLAALVACDSAGTDSGETGGSSGSDGASALPMPGLWEGVSNGVDVCFFVSADGLALTTAGSDCNVTGAARHRGAHSFDLQVEGVGTDDAGQPCSFELAFSGDIPIDPKTKFVSREWNSDVRRGRRAFIFGRAERPTSVWRRPTRNRHLLLSSGVGGRESRAV